MKRIYYIFILLLIATSCDESFLEVEPTNKLIGDNAINNLKDVEYIVNGAYVVLNDNLYYQGDYTFAGDIMADDFYSDSKGSGKLESLYNYRRSVSEETAEFFEIVYLGINHINISLAKAALLDISEEDQDKYNSLIAELKCIRALMHFDISKMYGPIYVTLGQGDIKEDAKSIYILEKPLEDPDNVNYRNTTKEVYEFVVKELKDNLEFLTKEKTDGRINYWAARGLLSRVYLYMGEYQNAYDIAVDIIENSDYDLVEKEDYIQFWKEAFNDESIFELSVTVSNPGSINSIGYLCLSDGVTGYRSITVSENLLDVRDNNEEDVRMELIERGYDSHDEFDGYYPMGKYPGRDGNVFLNNPKVLRMSEMYLIAAECALYVDPSQAGYYLTKLRKERTDDDPEKYLSSCDIDDILFERRMELFAEGHRVFDMRRNLKTIIRYEDDLEELGDDPDKEYTGGEIEFDWYKNIYPITDRELEFLPFADRVDEQNPGY